MLIPYSSSGDKTIMRLIKTSWQDPSLTTELSIEACFVEEGQERRKIGEVEQFRHCGGYFTFQTANRLFSWILDDIDFFSSHNSCFIRSVISQHKYYKSPNDSPRPR